MPSFRCRLPGHRPFPLFPLVVPAVGRTGGPQRRGGFLPRNAAAGGRYPRLRLLVVAWVCWLVCLAPGAPSLAQGPQAVAGTPEETVTVPFRLVGAEGEPVANGKARLFGVGSTGERTLLGEPAVDRAGRFAVPLPAGGALLEMTAPGHRRVLRWLAPPSSSSPEKGWHPGEGAAEGAVGGGSRERTVLLPPRGAEGAVESAPVRLGSQVEGRVVDAAGRPVAGARVELLHLDFETWSASPVPFYGPRAASRETPPTGEEPLLHTVTGPDGTFALEIRERIELPAQDKAALELVCTAPGHAAATVPVQREPRQEAHCRLGRESTRLAGATVTPGGEGVPWLPVTLMAPVPPAPWFGMVVSGPDGTFASGDEVPAAGEYVVVLNAPEAQPQVLRVPHGRHREVAVPLVPGAELQVEVTDAESGRPVAGAEVAVRLSVGPLTLKRTAEIGPASGEGAARGDAGLYRLPHLPPGAEAPLAVDAAGYLPHRSEVTVEPAGARIRVALQSAVRIVGRVTDGLGRPVPGARVTAVAGGDGSGHEEPVLEEERLSRRARATLGRPAGAEGADAAHGNQVRYTGEDGRFVLEGLVRGALYHVSVEAEGFAPWWDGSVPAEPARRGGNGRPAQDGGELEVVLHRGAVVEGAVLYDDGTPVVGASVRAVRVTPDPEDATHFLATPEAQRDAETGPDGRYRLTGLADGTYLVGSDSEGLHTVGQFHFDTPPPLPLLAGDVLTDLDFYLPRPGELRLWAEPDLAEADGGPPVVTFYVGPGDEPFRGERVPVQPRPESRGEWTVGGIAPGDYDLEVRFPGRLPARFEQVSIRSGVDTALEVEDPGTGRSLDLAVLDELGQPAAGAQVVLYRVTPNDYPPPELAPPDPRGGTGLEGSYGEARVVVPEIPVDNPSLVAARADDSGRLWVEGLEPGPYQLHASDEAGSYAYEVFDLPRSAADRPVERRVVLPRGFPVRVRVENDQGTPLALTKVVLTRRVPGFGGLQYEQLTGASGEAEFPALPAGQYDAELFTKYPAAEGLVRTLVHNDAVTIQGAGEWVVRIP